MTYPRRITVLAQVILAGFGVLFLRLLAVQVSRGGEFREKATQRVLRTRELDTVRGSITDRNGVVLASSNASRYAIAVRLDRLEELEEREPGSEEALLGELARAFKGSREQSAAKRAGELQEALAEIRKRLGREIERDVARHGATSQKEEEKNRRWTREWYLARPQVLVTEATFTDAMVVELEPDRFRCVEIAPDTTRRHPLGELACHVLGAVSPMWAENWEDYRHRYEDAPLKKYKMTDSYGSSGMELALEDRLRGTRGERKVVVSSGGLELLVLSETEPRFGEDVALSLDCQVQRAAEEALAGRRGAAVVMDVHTGEILCLASWPTYDRDRPFEELRDDAEKPLLPRATQEHYPAGSTYKLFVAVAGLESRVLTPDTFFRCEQRYPIGDTTFTCLGYHGDIELQRALVRSCNIYFYQAASRIGAPLIERWTRRFGFGEKTGIEVGETAGQAFGPVWKRENRGQRWYPGDTANLAIGQGETRVTAVQMARALAAIANGGKVLRPTLVRTDGKGEVVRELNLSESTVGFMYAAMADVVKLGTARAQFEGCRVSAGGKTGTAERGMGRSAGWFVGIAPMELARVSFAVVVEELEEGEHAADAACPPARRILETLSELGYLSGPTE